MELKDKNILIFGLGISGVSTVKALNKLGANIYILDRQKQEDLQEYLDEIRDIDVELYLGKNSMPLDKIDLIVKSPGIPLDLDILKEAEEKGIEYITDIELAYRIKPTANFIAITATNGKTTTTSLTGEYFKNAGLNSHVVGNIGVGLLWNLVNSGDGDVFIIEASSFQLETTRDFKPNISLIINLAPDHLNWHGSFDNYVSAKKKIYKNQEKGQFTVLNYDDANVRLLSKEIQSQIIWLSLDRKLDKGVYLDNKDIVINDGKEIHRIMAIDEILLPGRHNLENVLASLAIAWIMEIDLDIIRDTLRTFPGVEHRIEHVETIRGIKFFNDSKGTNLDASIKAIEALESPIILIAGGMDKGSGFDDLIKAFNGKIKALILLGETKEKIKATAIKYGFTNNFIVNTMEEAVNLSYKLGENGDNILLSPACASWDMYPSFEKRGNDFKSLVFSLRED